jgi:nucleotide-binding universal stress UspA family protein
MYRRILVTTDGSPLSHKAVESAIELAKAVGAELVALHVVPRYPVSYFEGSVANTPEETARIERQWTARGQEMVDAVQAQATAAGVKATTATAHSDLVAEAIIAAADKHECDALVMASHGRKGLQRLLLGSETQHVLTHSSIPVLVIR